MKTSSEEFIEKLNEGKIMTTDQYINHEVRLRVNEYKYKVIDKKLNWVVGLLVGGMLIPIFLHICWDFYEAIFSGLN